MDEPGPPPGYAYPAPIEDASTKPPQPESWKNSLPRRKDKKDFKITRASSQDMQKRLESMLPSSFFDAPQ